MTVRRYLARRALLSLVSVYGVVTATYLLGAMTIRHEIRNQLARARYEGASPARIEELRAGLRSYYGLNQPLHERLLGWYLDVTQLDFGQSVSQHEPVAAVLAGRVETTLGYVLPGLVLAGILGVGLGLAAAIWRRRPVDWVARVASYVGLGIPVFMLLEYLLYVGGWRVDLGGIASLAVPSLGNWLLATVAVALGLLAGILRFARGAILEQLGESFVTMLRAKGARRVDLARHVLRNAAIPIVSISITELLAVLVLNIYVIEAVLDIRGIAGASLTAAKSADVPLLIWATMVVVVLGITASFLQDVLQAYLDPRLGTR